MARPGVTLAVVAQCCDRPILTVDGIGHPRPPMVELALALETGAEIDLGHLGDGRIATLVDLHRTK